jgi:hypothetical protein
MKREDYVILYLSLSLLLCQVAWVRAEKRASFLEGKLTAFTFLETDHGTEGNTYVIDDNTTTPLRGNHAKGLSSHKR